MALRIGQGQRKKYLTMELSSTSNPVQDICTIVSEFQSAKIGGEANNAARCPASRFFVRAACLAAGVLGRPLRSVGCWAARLLRARATAPQTAFTTSLTT